MIISILFPVLLPYIAEKYGTSDLTIVSPNAGGVERARNFATRLENAAMAVVDKRRSGPNQVAEMKVVGDVNGKVCVIVDDIIDTGGTIIKAAETLLQEGATKVVGCCVHPVLSGNAADRLNNSLLEEIIVTDTIQIPKSFKCDKLKVVSVASLCAESYSKNSYG